MSAPDDELAEEDAFDPSDNECPWCGFPTFDCKREDEDTEEEDGPDDVDEHRVHDDDMAEVNAADDADAWLDELREVF